MKLKNKGEARTIPCVRDEYRLQDKAAKLGSGSQRKEQNYNKSAQKVETLKEPPGLYLFLQKKCTEFFLKENKQNQ